MTTTENPEVVATAAAKMETAIAVVQSSVASLRKVDEGIAAIEAAHPKSLIVDVTTPAGMRAAIAGRAAWRDPRIALEKVRKEAKAPLLKLGRELDTFAGDVEARLREGEANYDTQIKAEEERKAREKEARERVEREAREALSRRFADIRALPQAAVGKCSGEIDALIAAAEATDLAGVPDDMLAAMRFEVQMAVNGLRAAKDRALAAEAEAEKIAAERAELERLRAEAAERQAELDRLAAAERERLDTEARRAEEQARAEREAIERAEREAREAEQARIDAERAEQRRREDAERAEAARKLREQQEKAEADRKKLEAQRRELAKQQRAAAIANASAQEAMQEAFDLLVSLGQGEHLATQKLAACLQREPARKVA